jgi:PAS domain S-box-containing protein
MTVDMRTFAFILVILDLLLIVAIYLPFMLNKTYRGIGWWVLWGAATAAGFLFMLSRDIVPVDLVPASIFLTNVLLLAGQIFLYTGIIRFLDKRENRWLIISVSAVFVFSTIYVLYVSGDAAARALILYAAAAIFSFMAAQGLFAHKQRTFAASAGFVAVILLIHGSYFALRALAAITIAPIDPVFTPTLLQAATFVVTLITGTLCVAGLIIMVFQRASAEMRETKEQFELIFNTGPDASMITRLDDRIIVNINEGFTALTGFTREEAIGKSSLDLNLWKDAADRQNVVNQLAAQGFCDNHEAVFQMKDGSRITGTISARIITLQGVRHMISVVHDITERRHMEEEGQRISKLEALGQLSQGIANGFNDRLADILGNISLARMEAAPGSDIYNRLEEAGKAVLGAKDLTGQLLTFSQAVAPVKKSVSVADLLRDTTGFALRGSNVKCHLSIPDGLWHAEIDRGQVSQAVHNLVTNARQAMPAGGTIEITAVNMTLGETQDTGKGLPLREGNYVRISVTDNGSGITAEHMDKIFDPFFMTGQQDGGGLGLAVSFAIARQHGGHLCVESEPGSGSSFFLYLPAYTGKLVGQNDQTLRAGHP